MSAPAKGAPPPPPFCVDAWQRNVAALGVAIALTLGFAIHSHYYPNSFEPMIAIGLQDAPPPEMPAHPAGVAVPAPEVPVAQTSTLAALAQDPGSATDTNVRLIGTQQRTTFNTAARNIRPSVIGIRAVSESAAPGQPKVERLGSGLILDANGLAVTCNHVIAGASGIWISRFGEPERRLPARVVATENDLALLELAAPTELFTPAALADSGTVSVGDWVLAAGHPFGLGLTITAGIVGSRRGVLNIAGGPQYTGLLQTDAPINEGSSGGPLVDEAGNVVGLNMAIYAPTGVFSGTGFAIPSNRIREFVARVRPLAQLPTPALGAPTAPPSTTGTAGLSPWPTTTPSWGLSLGELTPDQRASLGQPPPGLMVTGVTLNSPADRAQLATGDVVVGIAGQPVPNLQVAQSIRNQVRPGQVIPIEIWRHGQTQMLRLELGANG